MNIKLPEGENMRIANSDDIARIMRKILIRQNRLFENQEYFWTIGLNLQNDIEFIELITKKIEEVNTIHPVDILHLAASKKCKKLIVCHNHLTNEVMPTDFDKSLTSRIKNAAKAIEIELLDHIIISKSKSFCSMKNLNLV